MSGIVTIDQINATVHEHLRFRDFVRLQSGYDDFSLLNLGELRKRMSAETHAAVESQIAEDEFKAKAYRWVLRGLEVSRAIRKAKVDAEVSENARIGKRG